jgi:FkbM family methyltransferase
MSVRSTVGGFMMSLLPERSALVYRLGRRIVNRYQGDNDGDMETNGEIWLARQLLPRVQVVFDVGANVGDWTKHALETNPHATYHCFEPSPVTFGQLQARGLPPNVVLNNIGLGDAPSERSLFVFGDGCGANSLYRRVGTEAAQDQLEQVTIGTFDTYCETRGIDEVGFVKLDVEGHEFAVLRGAHRMLSEGRIGIIQFEYGGTYIDARVLLKDIWEHVSTANPSYEFYKVFPHALRRIPAYTQTLETFQYSNWVIVRKGLWHDDHRTGAAAP